MGKSRVPDAHGLVFAGDEEALSVMAELSVVDHVVLFHGRANWGTAADLSGTMSAKVKTKKDTAEIRNFIEFLRTEKLEPRF